MPAPHMNILQSAIRQHHRDSLHAEGHARPNTLDGQYAQGLKRSLAAGLMVSALAASPAMAEQSTAQTVLQQSQSWNIPAQTLDRSITDLAEQAGLHILLQPGQLKGFQAPVVRGQMSTQQALKTLLKESGFSFKVGTGNRLMLVKSASSSQTQSHSAAPRVEDELIEDELVVIGNWLNQADSTTRQNFPGSRQQLTQEEMEKSGVSSLTEAFRKIPGVQVRVPAESYGANHALSIGVRGLKSRFSEKSTILLDGMPLSFAPYGQPQLSIAPVGLGNLAAIDVVKGGSSVRYGPQNVGGIINFVTPQISEETTARIKLKAESAIDDGEQNLLGQMNAFFSGKVNDDTGLALIYSGSHGSGFRENSDENIDDLMLKGETWLSDSELLEGHIRFFNAETDIPGGLNQVQYEQNPWQSRYDYNHFKGDRTEGRIRYTNEISATQEFEVQAFAANTYRLYGLQFNPDSRQRYDEWGREYDVYGIEPRYSQLFTTGDIDHEVSVGYRFVKEEADLTRYRWNNFAEGDVPKSIEGVFRTQDKAGTTAHAAFIDDRISVGLWQITPGVRLENVEVYRHSLVKKNSSNDFRNEESYTEVLPSLSVSYLLSPETTLFSNFSTSFGTLQHLQLSDSTDNNLEPEIARTFELGGRYNKDTLSAEVTLFNINFDNKLQWDDDLGHHVNKGETRHYGVELGASYQLPDTGLSVYGNLAYTQAEFREGELKGNELPYYSNWVSNLGMEYQQGRWTWNLDNYSQSSQFADNENTGELTVVNNTYYRGKLPSFSIWNTRVSYLMTEGKNASSIAFGVKNLFNKDYYTLSGPDQPYGAGISAGAPATAFVELDMKF